MSDTLGGWPLIQQPLSIADLIAPVRAGQRPIDFSGPNPSSKAAALELRCLGCLLCSPAPSASPAGGMIARNAPFCLGLSGRPKAIPALAATAHRGQLPRACIAPMKREMKDI